MTTVFSILRTNAKMFPRFAQLIAVVYAVVGVIIAIPVAVKSHSVLEGIAVALTVLVAVAIFDIITYLVIASKPNLLHRFQRAADTLANYNYSSSSTAARVDEDEDEEEDDADLKIPIEATKIPPTFSFNSNPVEVKQAVVGCTLTSIEHGKAEGGCMVLRLSNGKSIIITAKQDGDVLAELWG